MTSLIALNSIKKVYTRGKIRRQTTFTLEADFSVDQPGIIGVVGPNGAGKTTLFEMMTGSNEPTSGRVLIGGTDIHKVKYKERDRLAIHYHQSYQVRHFKKLVPSAMLLSSPTPRPLVHLFDEPQFNPQDGYIGFMLDFFKRLRDEGKLVFICLHPTATYHFEILSSIANRFMLVSGGKVMQKENFSALITDERCRTYLGPKMYEAASKLA
jgi:ABC-2 type transport system ATP-binding protein